MQPTPVQCIARSTAVDVVYHLVHSLGSSDFEALDRAAAAAVASAAAAGGARQIVYLGGLGEGATDLSPHLRSRTETAKILADGPVPLTTLRAAMIVGRSSAAFETILALVERLPVMVCPRWVSVETQPVALFDVVAALIGVCGKEATYDESFDLGGPEVMSYRKMMERVAHIRGKRPLLIEVPFLTPRLSSLWLYLVTPASVAVARPLVDGLRIPTVAHDDRIWNSSECSEPRSTKRSAQHCLSTAKEFCLGRDGPRSKRAADYLAGTDEFSLACRSLPVRIRKRRRNVLGYINEREPT